MDISYKGNMPLYKSVHIKVFILCMRKNKIAKRIVRSRLYREVTEKGGWLTELGDNSFVCLSSRSRSPNGKQGPVTNLSSAHCRKEISLEKGH